MSEINLDTLVDDLQEAYNPSATFKMDRESHAHLSFLFDHGKYSKRKRQCKKNMAECSKKFKELWG